MRNLILVCVLALVAGGIAVLGFAQTAKPAAKPVVWPAGDLKWVDNPAMKGAQQAILWGDPVKGAFGALKRITAGTVLPPHTHTNTMREVIVAGTIALAVDGQPAKDLGPQSYTMVPGGVAHTATCKAGADCVYFETSTGAYDLKLK